MVQKSTPPLTSVGSKTRAPRICRWVVGDSNERKAASRPVEPLHRYRPVDPKPASPRSLSASSCTSTNAAVSTRWTTNWAIRSPRSTS